MQEERNIKRRPANRQASPGTMEALEDLPIHNVHDVTPIDHYELKTFTVSVRCEQTPRGVDTPELAASLFSRIYEDLDADREHLALLALSAAHKPVGFKVLSSGTPLQTPVLPSKVLCSAMALWADAFILAHNHPSGDIKASHDDLDLTRRMVEAGRIVDIELLDHLILAPCGRFSSLHQNHRELWDLRNAPAANLHPLPADQESEQDDRVEVDSIHWAQTSESVLGLLRNRRLMYALRVDHLKGRWLVFTQKRANVESLIDPSSVTAIEWSKHLPKGPKWRTKPNGYRRYDPLSGWVNKMLDAMEESPGQTLLEAFTNTVAKNATAPPVAATT